MSSENLIISGLSENYDIPLDVSLGRVIIDKLWKRKRDDIVNIDGITNETVTCGELLDNVLRTISVYKSLGLKKGDIIAIIGENSIHYCVPFIASLYLGVVAQLLNPAYTIGELRHALSIAKPKVVLCQKAVLPFVVELKNELDFIERVILLDKKITSPENGVTILDQMLKNAPKEILSNQEEKFDCVEEGAFILMSSGTTGLPKCVLLTHANFRVPMGVVTDPRYGAINIGKEVVLTAIPMFHVLGLTIQMIAIISLNKLIVMNKFQPQAYLRCIERYFVTCLPLVPPILVFLTKYPLLEDYDFTAVQKVLCGAAALGKEAEKDISNIIENATVQQVYGITEVSGMCTFAPSSNYKPGSTGILVPNLQAKVWDPETGETLGPMKPGELCFKGVGVMKGYVGMPAESNDIDKDGFYHSGDIGYYDEDGFFYVTDRIKELIKYKGFQVSPTELEKIILTHPAIRDCAVIGIDDENAGQLPLAYCVSQSGSAVTKKDIIDYVADRISVQKQLHGGVRFINEIPKNPSGKILRKDLVAVYKST